MPSSKTFRPRMPCLDGTKLGKEVSGIADKPSPHLLAGKIVNGGQNRRPPVAYLTHFSRH